MKYSKSTFKLIAAGWGIWIEIGGYSSVSDKALSFLKTSTDKARLTDPQQSFVQRAFKDTLSQIKIKTGTDIMIVLTDIVIIPTDYQVQGLYYATQNWLIEHFDLEKIDFTWMYDKSSNKYIFPELERG